jgi:3-oxoacyl-[acyl-carrier-protein] synthase III
MLPIKIIATGIATPSEFVTSVHLDKILERCAGSTEKQSGVISRRFASPEDMQSMLAATAVKDALLRASLRETDIDLLIAASGVSEQALPNNGSAIARHLKLNPGTPAIDINASCLSFMAGLQVAAGLLSTDAYRRIAIVSADLPSRGIDWSKPEASLIFGDGAAAAIVERGDRQGIIGFELATHAEGFTHCEIRAGGTRRNPRVGVDPKDYLFRMNGKSAFKLALRTLPSMIERVLKHAQTTIDEIDVVIPHQASHLGLTHLTKRLALPRERLVNIYPTHGNQVAASIPTALHHAYLTGQAAPGKRAMLIGTAAGFTAGVAILNL